MFDPNQTADKIICQPAEVTGWRGRTVRLVGGKVPVCTSTYNYGQDEETRNELARRIAGLWTLAAGIPTIEIEAAAANGYKLAIRLGTNETTPAGATRRLEVCAWPDVQSIAHE